jgi:hypothetical protein
VKTSRRRGEGSTTSVGEERAQARIEHFRAGLAQVAQFDEGVKAEIARLVRKDEGLKDLNKALAKAAKAHQRASELLVSGKLSRSAAQAMINEAFAPLHKRSLIEVRQRLEDHLPARSRAFEANAVRALFDEEQRKDSEGWGVEGGAAGPQFFKPLFGQRRDPLPGDGADGPGPPPAAPMPYTDCGSKPYSDAFKVFFSSGPGLALGAASADAASGLTSSEPGASVVVLGGCGVYGEGLVGRQVHWPAGYSSLQVTATFDINVYLFALSIGFSYSGAGCDLLLDVSIDNASPTRRLRPMGVVIAPIFWWAQHNMQGAVTLSTRFNLQQRAGTAQLMAGIAAHAEASGTSFSHSVANVRADAKSICVTLS